MTEPEVDEHMRIHAQQIQDILDFVRVEGTIDLSKRFSTDKTCKFCGSTLNIEIVDGKLYAKCNTPKCFEIRDL